MKIPRGFEEGNLWMTRHNGILEIVSYGGYNKVKVRFIKTGYEVNVQKGTVVRGYGVADRLLPTLYGLGYIGGTRYRGSVNGITTKCYKTWHSMFYRCYNEYSLERDGTYRDCTVCEEWYNFQNFARWFEINYKEGLHLDKDILTEGNREYSPECCSFVPVQENSEKAHAVYWTFNRPDGAVVEVYNLHKFCRDNGLCQGGMNAVDKGNRPHHKGWTKGIKKENK